jgi:hypothetical protein
MNRNYLNDVDRMLNNPIMPNVYFILAFDELGNDNMVKIGVSVDPVKRFEDLSLELWKESNGYPDWLDMGYADLRLLGYVQGHQQLETALHKAFKDKSRGREWFSYDQELEGYVDGILEDYCVCHNCILADIYSGSGVPMPQVLKGIQVKLLVKE